MDQPTVLVVDDDQDIRELTKLALESVAGWQVATADGGSAAVTTARSLIPDAILLDIMMPEIDGLTAVEMLQSHASTRHIPVILVTAKAWAGWRQPWDGYAVTGVIQKPYDPATLATEVARLLRWDPVPSW